VNNQGLCVGVLNYNAGKEKLYYIEGGVEKEREVTVQDDIVGLVSYGRFVSDKLSLGGTIKVGTSKIAELKTAYAYAVDVGVLYYLMDSLIVSLAGQNLGTTTKFVEKQEKLPISVWLGLGFIQRFAGDYFVSVGCDAPYIVEEGRVVPSFGVEFGKMPVSIFLGYRLADEAMYAVGISLTMKSFDLSYSYIPSMYLSHTNRLSLGVRF
ncbi:MAG: hypothetical protein NZ928_04210, partial [Endomicrobia bacterium]|nr:hypothetical protein [Endomicrobiia bacterium]